MTHIREDKTGSEKPGKSGLRIAAYVCGVGTVVCLVLSYGFDSEFGMFALLGIFFMLVCAALTICSLWRRRNISGKLSIRGSKNALLFLIFWLVMLGLLIPSLERPCVSRKIVCMSNLRSLGLGIRFYVQESEDLLPRRSQWCDLIRDYAADGTHYRCPVDKEGDCSYAFNENLPARFKDVEDDMVVLFESDAGWNQVGGIESVVSDRHDKPGCNVFFADGHVEFVRSEDISGLRWKGD